ncbi:MAG: hypothetical protein Alis3KO_02520 [Aliiglaciecola sp.]
MFLSKWKRFEKIVAAVERAHTAGAKIEWNEKINGRQFDVTVRFKYGNHDYLTVIECKATKRKVSVEKVDAFATKSRDVNCSKAVIVSSNGFQNGCFDVANKHGIELLTLSEVNDSTSSQINKKLWPAYSVFDIEFLDKKGKLVFRLEDYGGSLAYFCNETKIVVGNEQLTPNELIDKKLDEYISPPDSSESDLLIQFQARATIYVPYENTVFAHGLKFKVRIIEVEQSEIPYVDNHIREKLDSRVELKNENGSVVSSTPLLDLKLGFDTPLEVGRFYELPSLFTFYYCEKVEDDMVTWIVVESYQHGILWQATLTQKLEYASSYVPVESKVKVMRLKKMLKALKKKKKHPLKPRLK